jgi:hypothetical protein
VSDLFRRIIDVIGGLLMLAGGLIFGAAYFTAVAAIIMLPVLLCIWLINNI